MEVWVSEAQTPDMRISLRVDSILHRERSDYQEIVVADTPEFGRVLLLDDVIQTTERDEFTYHEMLAHVPLVLHPAPRDVLVIGGGDGGALREVLKHPVSSARLVDIDPKVIEASRRYLPSISAAMDDPRARIAPGDGIKHVREVRAAYDAIIVDSTDPVGPAAALFSPEFYADVHAALREDGVFVTQSGSPFFNQKQWAAAHRGLKSLFPRVAVYLGVVPTYPGGAWTYTLASKRYHPTDDLQDSRAAGLSTRFYSAPLHRAAFNLYPFMREILTDESGD